MTNDICGCDLCRPLRGLDSFFFDRDPTAGAVGYGYTVRCADWLTVNIAENAEIAKKKKKARSVTGPAFYLLDADEN